MIYLKVKDGGEDKAKFYIGGTTENIYIQSFTVICSITDLFAEHYDTKTAETYLTAIIEDLKDYYGEKFLKDYTDK